MIGINKAVRESGSASVIHKIAIKTNKANALLAGKLSKTGNINKMQKRSIAMSKGMRLILFFI